MYVDFSFSRASLRDFLYLEIKWVTPEIYYAHTSHQHTDTTGGWTNDTQQRGGQVWFLSVRGPTCLASSSCTTERFETYWVAVILSLNFGAFAVALGVTMNERNLHGLLNIDVKLCHGQVLIFCLVLLCENDDKWHRPLKQMPYYDKISKRKKHVISYSDKQNRAHTQETMYTSLLTSS